MKTEVRISVPSISILGCKVLKRTYKRYPSLNTLKIRKFSASATEKPKQNENGLISTHEMRLVQLSVTHQFRAATVCSVLQPAIGFRWLTLSKQTLYFGHFDYWHFHVELKVFLLVTLQQQILIEFIL